MYLIPDSLQSACGEVTWTKEFSPCANDISITRNKQKAVSCEGAIGTPHLQ